MHKTSRVRFQVTSAKVVGDYQKERVVIRAEVSRKRSGALGDIKLRNDHKLLEESKGVIVYSLPLPGGLGTIETELVSASLGNEFLSAVRPRLVIAIKYAYNIFMKEERRRLSCG